MIPARASGARPMIENPLREAAFSALHRATRDLTIQRKIRLLPLISGFAMLAILVMTISFGVLGRHSTARVRDSYRPLIRMTDDVSDRLAHAQRQLADSNIRRD